MKEFIEYIVKNLVDKPENVNVKCFEGEGGVMVRAGSAQVMTADPAEFTPMPTAKPSTWVSRVLTAVQLPPAGRLAGTARGRGRRR